MTERPKLADQYRLPTNVKPVHYDLTICTDLKNLKFDGYVTIQIDIVQDTNSIQFHASTLKLGLIKLTSDSLAEEMEQEVSSHAFDDQEERVTMKLPATLLAGSQARLKIDFSGDLAGNLMGYYRAKFEQNGEAAYYALTQFQATSARRAFPCWDEPALKATFSITMVSRVDAVNLSNTSIISEEVYSPLHQGNPDLASWLSSKFSTSSVEESEKWKITTFEKTPPMSTYLVAWANGPFEHIEDTYTSPVSGTVRPLRIYTTADAIHQAQFTLSVKKMVMPIYEQMFDIEYPLSKLDTLVVADFDFGGMENWGLIAGRTSGFLIDPQNPSIGGKQGIATMQSHEIAHMWFGDITTMEWWDNLYLNEGFATLVGETIVIDKIFPEWNVRAAFVSNELEWAMSADAKLSSHPIEVDCPDPRMISQIFDALSYDKAASILRMLSYYVTEEKFLKGVTIYLKKHLYANSITKNLWEGIAESSGFDVPGIMENWVMKMGFPVVRVTEAEGGIRIRQDRFFETGPADTKHNETIWSIPLSLLTTDNTGQASIDSAILLGEREKFIPLDTSKHFKLNAGTVSIFRVLYEEERFIAIAKEAAKEDSLFSLEDRIGLVQDVLALARAGYLKINSALALCKVFSHEKEYLVWKSIANILSSICSTWFEYPEIVGKLNAFCREMFAPIVKRLGYTFHDGEDVGLAQLRITAIYQAAQAGDTSVIEELVSRFDKLVDTGDGSYIPADLISITYLIAVKHGGRREFDFVKESATRPKTPQIGLAAMRAMGASDDTALQEETWEYIMTKSRDQNLPSFFAGLQDNPNARHFLAKKFKQNYDTLLARFGGTFGLKNLLQNAFSSLSSDTDYQEIVEFFKDKDTAMYKMALEQALDSIQARSAWIKRSTGDLHEWLEDRT